MARTGGLLKEIYVVDCSADVDLANDGTLNDDGYLKYDLQAGDDVHWELYAFYNAGAGGIQAGMSGPAGFTKLYYSVNLDISGATKVTSALAGAWDVVAAQAAASTGLIRIIGHLHNGVNAGDLVFRWAQNVSNAANTTIYEGSSLILYRYSD